MKSFTNIAVVVLAMTTFLHAQDEAKRGASNTKPVEDGKPKFYDLKTRDFHDVFEQALVEYDDTAFATSAKLIEKVAAVVSKEANKANKGDDQRNLEMDAKSLNSLATKVRDGRAKDSKVLKRVFAETHQVLVNHHINIAKRTVNMELGLHLLSAVRHTEEKANMTDVNLSAANKEALNKVKELGNELLQGEKIASAKIKSGIADLNKACQSISH